MQLDKWGAAFPSTCALDIDGVLNNYPANWVNWLYLRGYRMNSLAGAKSQLSYSNYREFKKQFRYEGEPAEVKEGASAFTHALKRKGYEIYIITARPFSNYRNLSKDTTNWLRDNDIMYDGIISDRTKHIRILELYPNLSFMVEDHQYYANLVAGWGYKVYLMNLKENQANKHIDHHNIVRVGNLGEILCHLSKK